MLFLSSCCFCCRNFLIPEETANFGIIDHNITRFLIDVTWRTGFISSRHVKFRKQWSFVEVRLQLQGSVVVWISRFLPIFVGKILEYLHFFSAVKQISTKLVLTGTVLKLSRPSIDRFKITFTGNGRNHHITMFILHLPLAVFSSVSIKLNSFALAWKAKILLHKLHLCTHFFKKK